MKFFESDTPVCDENGEIFWDKSKSIAQVKKVINHHHMNIVKKTEIQKEASQRKQLSLKKILLSCYLGKTTGIQLNTAG